MIFLYIFHIDGKKICKIVMFLKKLFPFAALKCFIHFFTIVLI
jgi:hypothetical protein